MNFRNLSLVAILFLTLAAHAETKTVCAMGVGSDDAFDDLNADEIYTMKEKDGAGRDLHNIPMSAEMWGKTDLRSETTLDNGSKLILVGRVTRVSTSGQKQMQFGVEVPGVGPIFTTDELSDPNEVKTLLLDLRGSRAVVEKLGSQYNDCEDPKNDCLSNFVLFSCGPQERMVNKYEIFKKNN